MLHETVLPCGAGYCDSVTRGEMSGSGRPGSNRRRSAWKADALPTELLPQSVGRLFAFASVRAVAGYALWRVMDSNHRRHSRQIYSLLPLATRATLQELMSCRTVACSWLSGGASCVRRESRQAEAELTSGIEPLTACLQNRCSAGLSYVSVEAATTTASSL